MIGMFGIPDSDTVKKAGLWLADHDVFYRFHDFRKDGLDGALLDAWIDRLGWEPLLNRAGATFRKWLSAGSAYGLSATDPCNLALTGIFTRTTYKSSKSKRYNAFVTGQDCSALLSASIQEN